MAFRDAAVGVTPHPRYVVWELTLKCDLACQHCGSRAGHVRDAELNLDEAERVADQLVEAGTAEITFIGGEAYLWPEWLSLVRYVSERGIRASLTTGGRQFDAETAARAADAGLLAVNVSVDGLEPTHDRLRNLNGSFKAALQALQHGREAGLTPHSNTQFNRLNLPEVELLAQTLIDAGVRGWQVQITGPMGRAADRPEWLLQPYDMLELVPRLGHVARDNPQMRIEASNNLGYFGPWEQHLRRAHFQGCQAGKYVLGIEANGDVKGCPSLPSAPYVGGNLRDHTLAEVLQTPRLRFSQDRDLDELWGFCKTCYYADTCRGGCAWTSHTLLGRRGNMPYCHHRASTLQEQGLRERVVRVEAAPNQPFDFGRFELIEEPLG